MESEALSALNKYSELLASKSAPLPTIPVAEATVVESVKSLVPWASILFSPEDSSSSQ